MILNALFSKWWVWLLFTLPLLAWLLPAAALEMEPKIIHENVNLALRRTADGLLRLSGDSTSRIPVVEQTSTNVWRLRLEIQKRTLLGSGGRTATTAAKGHGEGPSVGRPDS